jgi:hypothetical protein
MMWHVQYRKGATSYVARHPSPEQAIEAACHLLDDGCDVYGIGTGPLTDSIDREQIARIYAMWARVKFPFGIMPPVHRQAPASPEISPASAPRPLWESDSAG